MGLSTISIPCRSARRGDFLRAAIGGPANTPDAIWKRCVHRPEHHRRGLEHRVEGPGQHLTSSKAPAETRRSGGAIAGVEEQIVGR